MSPQKFTSHILIVLAAGIALPVLGSLAAVSFAHDWRLPHEPLHSVIESLGGFIALTLAGILLTEKTRQPEKAHHVWMACALISMGTLDIFHAVVSPGNLFVWLHSTAQFAGGIFFALVCLPRKISDSPLAERLPWPLFFTIITLGVLSILFVESIPEMVVQGKFSPLARGLNILGGIGFLVASGFFVVRYQSDKVRNHYLFALHCALFGAAGVLFELSQLWDAAWWWHLLRLMAYGTGLALVVSSYLGTEKKLQESEASLRSIFDNTPSVIYLKDSQSRFLMINRQFEKIFGIKNQDITGKTPLDIFQEDVARQHIENDRKVIAAGHPLESEEDAPHGDRYHTYLSVKFPIKDHAENIIAICGISNDITERKRTEEKIKALSKFPDENPQPVLRISDTGELLYANKSSSQLLETWNINMGQTVPISWHHLVTEVITSQSSKAVEVMVNERHYLMMMAYIEGGKHVNIYGADITKSKHSDKRLKFYTDELERSNKDLEDFAYLASHDLLEPLRKITTFGDRLVDTQFSMDIRSREYVVRMQKAAVRMRDFIEALLEYSKISKIRKQSKMIDIGLIIANIKEDLEYKIRQCNGTLQIGNMPTLEGDPDQLQILFQNLISNSLKYHQDGVDPILKLTSSYFSETKTWEIELADNGIGIEKKYFERIFKPFERLHGRNTFEGTGIGLAICKKIVERHHGSINVSSAPQKGSTFKISLPQKQPALPI